MSCLPGNRTEFTFKWTKPGFPGTIIAGKFLEPISAGNMRVYVTEKHKEFAHDFAKVWGKLGDLDRFDLAKDPSGKVVKR